MNDDSISAYRRREVIIRLVLVLVVLIIIGLFIFFLFSSFDSYSFFDSKLVKSIIEISKAFQCKFYKFQCCSNLDCNDNDPVTFDECVNPKTDYSYCSNIVRNECDNEGDCNDNNPSTQEICTGFPKKCSNVKIIECVSGDNYCPNDCDFQTDNDCEILEEQCSDGTLLGQCSLIKPKYCENGVLINKCNICGCPYGQSCDANIGECSLSLSLDIKECIPGKMRGSSSKFDIVFLSDYYTTDTINNFKPLINIYLQKLSIQEPFKSNLDELNFLIINNIGSIRPAGDLLVDHPDYWNISSCEEVDLVVVVEDPQNGVTSGAVTYTGDDPIWILMGGPKVRIEQEQNLTGNLFVHEFGHAFANLGDEFFNEQIILNYTVDYEYFNHPNIDFLGCPKWCSGQVNAEAVIPESNIKCKDALNVLNNCIESGETDCFNVLDAYLVKASPYGLSYCDIGVNCKQGTGCYWNARAVNAYRSSPDSIMKNVNSVIEGFNLISREAILKELDKYS